MANRESETHESDKWMDDRLAGLTPGRDWTPDAGRAFARLQARGQRRAPRSRRWIWTTLAAACAYFTLLMLPSSRACAQQPGPCVLRVLGVNPQNENHFKQMGNAAAPVTLEIYLDYGDEDSAAFVRDVLPPLTEQYVETGKVKLLFRDYPLTSHPRSSLAARYANAAGELGYFEPAMRQLYATQLAWNASGDIDSALSNVLPAGVMENLRSLVLHPDSVIGLDLEAARTDHVDYVPFAVIVSEGRRGPVSGAPLSLDSLKSHLGR